MAMIRKREGKKRDTDGKVRKTITWQATVRKGDHPAKYKSFKTKREAEAWATSVEDAINKDEFVPSPESRRRTIREMLERYRETESPKKRDFQNENRYLDFWIYKLGVFKISAVSRSQIVELRDEMARTKAPATVNRYLATFRHAFRIAETDWEWASRNPLQRIMLSEPRGRDRHLSDDEITALLSAAKESDHPHLYALVLTALSTGARRGEIMGLSWADVDLTKGRALLHHTKNTDKRTLVLVPRVVEELRRIQKVRRIDTDLVFANPNNGKRTYQRIEDAWRAARAEAKLKDFRFHDLRHTFASRMAMDGKTLQEIAGALGHRTLAMVQRYAHLTDSHVQTAMEETALKVLGDG